MRLLVGVSAVAAVVVGAVPGGPTGTVETLVLGARTYLPLVRWQISGRGEGCVPITRAQAEANKDDGGNFPRGYNGTHECAGLGEPWGEGPAWLMLPERSKTLVFELLYSLRSAWAAVRLAPAPASSDAPPMEATTATTAAAAAAVAAAAAAAKRARDAAAAELRRLHTRVAVASTGSFDGREDASSFVMPDGEGEGGCDYEHFGRALWAARVADRGVLPEWAAGGPEAGGRGGGGGGGGPQHDLMPRFLRARAVWLETLAYLEGGALRGVLDEVRAAAAAAPADAGLLPAPAGFVDGVKLPASPLPQTPLPATAPAGAGAGAGSTAAPGAPLYRLNNGVSLPYVGMGTSRTCRLPALREALAAGYRFFDLAAIYREDGARTEEHFGRAWRAWSAAGRGKRAELHIMTKLNFAIGPHRLREAVASGGGDACGDEADMHHVQCCRAAAATDGGAFAFGHAGAGAGSSLDGGGSPVRRYVRCAMAKQLHDLRTSYVDSYMVHHTEAWGGDAGAASAAEQLGEVWEAMEELYHEGRIRALALSDPRRSELQHLWARADAAAGGAGSAGAFTVAQPEPPQLPRADDEDDVAARASTGAAPPAGERLPAVAPQLVQQYLSCYDDDTQCASREYLEHISQMRQRGVAVLGHSTLSDWPKSIPLMHDPHVAAVARVTSAAVAPSAVSAVQVLLRYQVELGHLLIPRSSNPRHMRSNMRLLDFALAPSSRVRLAALPWLLHACAPPRSHDAFGLAPLLSDIAGAMRCDDDPSSDAWLSKAQPISAAPFRLPNGTALKAAREEAGGAEEEEEVREDEDEDEEHREL